MNETRGNARTKPMKRGDLRGEKNSLKDSEKTNELRIKGCLLHNSDLWKTPKKMYNYFIKNNFFDPCPTNPTFNGLEIEWKEYNFVNPPYSQISKWIDKAIIEMKKGHKSFMLIPARTDTQWFKKLVNNNCMIYFLEGRLHFNDSGSAPFPSMLVSFALRPPFLYHLQFAYLEKKDFEWNK